MECNRDEASRAKLIAERKLAEKDFSGAKKFILKAQTLYPGLDGLSQLMTTLDVYISAENKISGEVDWYGILGVNPSADDEAVKKQYRKLALMLHPDKNKSTGAEGAFKLISEAWSLLSDKTKRLAYNLRRSSRGLQQNISAQYRGPPVPPRAPPKPPSKVPANVNGYHKFTNRASSYVKTQNNSARMGPTSVPPPSHQRTDTFWTICNGCKMHYEYLKMYLNQTLLCPNCHEAFLASEVAPPFNFPSSSNLSSRQRHQNPSHQGTSTNQFDPRVNSFDRTHVHQGPFSKTAGLGSTVISPSTAAQAANVVQQANKKVKREYEEAETASRWEKNHLYSSVLHGESLLKKSRPDDDRNRCGIGGFVFSGFNNKPNSTRELTLLEIRNMLTEKARREIRKKLNERSSENVDKSVEKGKERKKEQEGAVKGDTYDPNGYRESSGTKKGEQAKKCFPSTPAGDKEKEDLVPMSIDVPDPDFHDFDQDRTESCFAENQVWASYDGDDGMPRLYAIIHKVISLKPFKMQISWLNSKTTNEFGSLDWISSGFAKTCGDFRVGRYQTNKSLNSFSHKVKCSKGNRGVVCIYPKKGDIWALYRNWSPDWNEHTPDEEVHKYDMVEVLDDYNEDQGVTVTPLIKVPGFRTVFNPCLEKVRRIRKEEMFRFSHQVPNYLLSGQEAQNAPKGCQELDPAATPLELLQKTTETNEVPMVGNSEIVDVGILQSTLAIKSDENKDNDAEGEKEVVNTAEELSSGR